MLSDRNVLVYLFTGFLESAEENDLRAIGHTHVCDLIKKCYQDKICNNADLDILIKKYPII